MPIKARFVALGLAGTIALLAPVANAATSTSSVNVSATVLAFCSISATPLQFGNYSASQLDSSTSLSISCTNGTAFTVGLDAGTGTGATINRRVMRGTADGSILSYGLYRDAARTNVWGNTVGTDTIAGAGNGRAQTLTVYGRIPGNQLVSPGDYTDVVTATVTY